MVDFLRALSIVLLLGMFYLAFKNKKFKRFLLIESVLIIVFIIGRQMYTSNLNTMDTVMWSLASDVTNKMITQSDKNIENNMHDVLSTIYDGNGFDIKQNIAFEYKVKDKYKLNNKNFIIFFKDSTNDKYTLFNLEKSFNKKEINNLLDFYNQNQDGCTIKKMSFHSKDNQYIIDQIVFYDENSHMTYKLGNSQGTMNYYSWYKYQNKKANDQNRLGDFELMFFNSKQTLEKNPKEKDIKVEQETCAISSDKSKIYVHYVNKENSILYNIEEIQNFLKNNYQYTYRPGLTGQDKDPVNEFLTERKRGFCTQFASAAVFLFREAGIPARYVEGYKIRADQWRLGKAQVTDYEAHAWTEIYIEHIGWIPVEVTGRDTGESVYKHVEQEEKQRNAIVPNKKQFVTNVKKMFQMIPIVIILAVIFAFIKLLQKKRKWNQMTNKEKVLFYEKQLEKYAENGAKSRNNSNSMTSEIIEKARYSNKDITRHELNLVKRHLDLLKRKNGNVTKILTKPK